MTEEEYWGSDEEFDNDGEFGDRFLHEETDGRINIVELPIFDYDMDEFLKGYLKTLKKCKSTEEAMEILQELAGQLRILTIVELECGELQNRALELEVLMQQVNIR